MKETDLVLNQIVVSLEWLTGGAVTPLGIGEFKITLCGVTVNHPVIVADIEAPMILGYDFEKLNPRQ